ncbi:DNA excision/repair protein SNF2 [Angomonas deanei]|uniref:Helicase conserved C-terminal domain containing protein, putative n=1 Tax=Angomonas deanei TaxID=59799 RepID=A0A7G2CNW2_9TRYP|nr:DNA excision/repair protein SNF2 [Angomonas deanei]CAD2221175.1 Helicase conserved C-terminal domain containing protein, putative [Angomonas deanei]|eukprot:EPY20867.1 DNA excision/repair protein SNF2 [Angomonas deanei]
MLRREKKDVSQVGSSKHDSVVWIRLSSVQRALYEAFLKTAEVATALQTDSKSNPLVLLTSLSQICVHPWLNLTEGGFREAMNKPHSVPCEGLGTISSSSKIGVTMALLQQALKDDRKTLVFSRSKRLLHMVAYLLDEASISFCRFDGDLSATDRHQAVTTFNDSPSVKVCLLTTQVGGVGLTFTSASCVILMDPSWNPSADSQAIDRVHRIGQTRDVQVFRLISTGTVEEKVYRNQIFKLMAARQIAGEDGSHLFRYFTKLQLRSMFEVGDLEDSETARQLEELHPDRVTDTVRAYTSSIPQVAAVSDNGCVLTERITGGEEMEEYSQPFSEKRSRTTSVSPGRPPRFGKILRAWMTCGKC